MKPLYLVLAAGAGISTVALLVYFGSTSQPVAVYSEGNFTVHVMEDSSDRFFARVENNGPTLENAGAFGVKKGLNELCEPQGIVVANFDVREQGGNQVPNPDSIPGNSSIVLDSRRPGLDVIPTGPDFETSVYIVRFEPGSITASDLIERIPIQLPSVSEVELFEHCLLEQGSGYPLQLKLVNPQRDTQVFISITDSSNNYKTAISIDPEAPDLSALFWPISKTNWLAGNYTQPSGPAPAWLSQQEILVSISLVSEGNVSNFENRIQPKLVSTSVDFLEVAKGNPLPSYPKYWEVQVDLANRIIN